VRTNGGGAFTALSPRQQLTPTPYAEFATTASNVSGSISFAQLPAGLVTNNESALTLTGNFSGNGAGLTNVNAATLNGLASGSFWQLGGNNVAGGEFIGSINNQPIEIWTSGQRAMRLEPDTTGSGSPNVIGGSIGNFMPAAASSAVLLAAVGRPTTMECPIPTTSRPITAAWSAVRQHSRLLRQHRLHRRG